jgi:hypothetical protein
VGQGPVGEPDAHVPGRAVGEAVVDPQPRPGVDDLAPEGRAGVVVEVAGAAGRGELGRRRGATWVGPRTSSGVTKPSQGRSSARTPAGWARQTPGAGGRVNSMGALRPSSARSLIRCSAARCRRRCRGAWPGRRVAVRARMVSVPILVVSPIRVVTASAFQSVRTVGSSAAIAAGLAAVAVPGATVASRIEAATAASQLRRCALRRRVDGFVWILTARIPAGRSRLSRAGAPRSWSRR